MHLSKNKLDHMFEIPKKSYVVTIVFLQSCCLVENIAYQNNAKPYH